MSTGNWKSAEAQLANVLQEFNIPAFRKTTRSGNWGVSDDDVGIEGADWLKNDSKYSKASPFKNHRLLSVIEEKYCKSKDDVPVLYTKNYKEHFGCITVKVKFFAMLLSYWLGHGTKEELWAIYTKKSSRKSNE